MPRKGEHRAKGWAATYGRVSLLRNDIAKTVRKTKTDSTAEGHSSTG